MSSIDEYINSGILEMYVMGMTSAEETVEVNNMASKHIKVSNEIDEISRALEIDASKKVTTAPSDTVKAFLLSVIDYSERLNNGECVTVAPKLTKESKIVDFAEWINRADMVLPADFLNIYAKLISHTAEATTAISWIKSHSPIEVHTNELESFLIIEGTCDIIIGDDIHSLKTGDFITIPLHIGHSLVVTSSIPCKVILQRVAA